MTTHDRPDPARPVGEEDALVARMSDLATELLAGLDPERRSVAHWTPLDDDRVEQERLRWFYTPTDHGGVALGALAPRQQRLVLRLVASGLTRAAYVTLCTVLGLENVLDELEGWRVDWGRERGRDPGSYWLRIFGRPGDTTWGWRFGGHHVSVSVLLRDGRIASATPVFLGADPASSPLSAGVLRPLGGLEDLAHELVRSLRPAQRRTATLHPRAVSDIVSGNRARVQPGDRMIHMQDLFRGSPPTPGLAALVDEIDARAEAGSGYRAADHERVALDGGTRGLAAADMAADQRELLRTLIAAYTDRSPVPVARAHRALYRRADVLETVRFGWAGDTARGGPNYHRITAPRLLVEYDNTQRGANHAHSVLRDPVGDFGLDALAEHRRAAPHA